MAAASQARTAAGIRTPLVLVGVALALLAFVAMFALGIVFVNRGGTGQQASIVVGRATFVGAAGFLWVDDGNVREMLRTRCPTVEMFVDPSPRLFP